MVTTSDCHPGGPGLDPRLYPRNGDDAVGQSTVSRWASRLSAESKHTNNRNFSGTGRAHSTQTPDNLQRCNNPTLTAKLIAMNELLLEVGVV